MFDFLGLKFNKNKDLKPLIISILGSYLCIFLVILIKSLIVGDTINDVYELAKGLSIFSTIFYGCFCLFQEVLFRGILQRKLSKKFNNIISIIITTILFLICHFNYDIVTVIGAFFISIIAGIMTIKDDNIYKAFFFHWIVGGIGYVFITLAFI